MVFQAKPAIHLDSGCSDYSVNIGDPVCVEVAVSGYPPPAVTWLISGEELINSEDVKIEKDKDKHKMIITKAAIRQSGSYTIRAANEAGQDHKDFMISVLGMYAY